MKTATVWGRGNYSYIFTRLRTDDVITVVDYQTGDVLARRRFEGQSPDQCPQSRGARRSHRRPPPQLRNGFPGCWPKPQKKNSALAPLRSTLAANRSAYLEPDDGAETLAHFDESTPIHPLGRAGNDWLLVLLPDMSMGWVQTGDVRPSAQVAIADLPDTSGIVGRPAFVAERADQLAQFSEFRPLGRFRIPTEYITVSHDRFYIASVENPPRRSG